MYSADAAAQYDDADGAAVFSSEAGTESPSPRQTPWRFGGAGWS
jgi:hypothetical protein